MTELSRKTSEALCNLLIATKSHCPEMISSASIAYYSPEYATQFQVIHLKKIRSCIAAIQSAAGVIDCLIDELEGRTPPVKRDEQEAA